jgi:hypothetical protein
MVKIKALLRSMAGLALPLLAAAFPILYLYGINVWVLDLASLKQPLGYSLLVAAAVYAGFFLLQRSVPSASLSATAFMLFYYTYGLLYNLLMKPDRFPVYHFSLLPLVIALAIYVGFFISHLKPGVAASLKNILLMMSAVLVVYNLAVITPVEIQKAQQKKAPPIPVTGSNDNTGTKYPDIYYIIFDEFAGFPANSAYFHSNTIAQFNTFLQQHHFFVATNSRAVTINTQTEMASRLNLQQYYLSDDPSVTNAVLDNNKVMQVLKSYGYTTAVLNMFFQGINADYTLPYDPQQVSGMAADQFKQTFFGDTMFNAFSGYFLSATAAEQKQRDLILYTLNQTVNLPKSVTSPKFVYTHLLMPHEPYIFDANGNLLPPEDNYDNHFYIGQYEYTAKLAEDLITKLLANADPANPPVIIVQSDEGARNIQRRDQNNVVLGGVLENYPIDNAYYILNAMYLPGYDTSQLPDNLPPIDTFVVVLNHYLAAGITVDDSGK